mgnify:CR=1 FL=1|jgi:hypothetical protein
MKTKLFSLVIIALLFTGCAGKRVGAVCEDGSRSSATGRGACSWHGGVDYWVHEND